MKREPKDIIDDFRNIVKPSISNILYKSNFDNLGRQDKIDFEEEFDIVLNLAEIGLKHISENN